MNELEVTLPVCKGTAWLRTQLSDGRMDEIEDARVSRLPPTAMAALYKAWEDKTLDRNAVDDSTTVFLMARGFTGKELRAAAKEADRSIVRVVVRRWLSVRGPESDEDLAFPDGIPDMHPADFDHLLLACLRSINDGRADPNASGEPSAGTSEPVSTSNGSHATSEMQSDSTSSMKVVAAGAGAR